MTSKAHVCSGPGWFLRVSNCNCSARRSFKFSAGVGTSAAISKRKIDSLADALGAWPTACDQAALAAAFTLHPKSGAEGTKSAWRFSHAANKLVRDSPWAWAANLRSAISACSMASRCALKAVSLKRGPRSGRSNRSPVLSPKPPRSERGAPLPSRRSPGPRPAGAGTDFF